MTRLRGVLSLALALAMAAPAYADEAKFNPTGGEQTFTVPAGVTTLRVLAIGGRGGTGAESGVSAFAGDGGFGAVAQADLAVTPGQLLYIEVGGNGGSGADGGAGGFNGGGPSFGGVYKSGGGGGASDVRTAPRTAAGTLGTRLVTAGGGGGGGASRNNGASANGGKGGSPGEAGGNCATGPDSATGGQPATATAGGAGGAGPFGGNGTTGSEGAGGQGVGAGGGGGLFGGGGGGYISGGPSGSHCGAGGGGGSSGFGPGTTSTLISIDTTGNPSITLTWTAPPPGDPGGSPGGGGTPTPPPPQPPADTAAPVITSYVLSPSAFQAANVGGPIASAARVGATVVFRLSEVATTTFTVQRKARGVRRGGRCVTPPRVRRRGVRACTRWVAVRGTFQHQGSAGLNSFRFMGRIGGKALRPGSYRLIAVAVDGVGNASGPKRHAFRIVR